MPMPKMATAVMTSMMLKPFLRRNQTNPNRLALISLLASVASFMPHHSQLFHFVRQNFGIETETRNFNEDLKFTASIVLITVEQELNYPKVDKTGGHISRCAEKRIFRQCGSTALQKKTVRHSLPSRLPTCRPYDLPKILLLTLQKSVL
jgi:hypothetical protein